MRALHDCHIHSSFSTDSETPMEEMAQAAVSLGLAGIAITDHYHPDYPIMMHRTGQPTTPPARMIFVHREQVTQHFFSSSAPRCTMSRAKSG